MNERELDQLLATADADVPPPRLSRDLALRARSASRRSASPGALLRVAAAVIAAIGLAGSFAVREGRSDRGAAVVQSGMAGQASDADSLSVETITSELRVLERTVRGVEAARKWAARPKVIIPPSPLVELQEEVESAADALVAQAVRCERELNLPESARKRYELVIEVFPNTPAAADARVRLAAMESTPRPAS